MSATDKTPEPAHIVEEAECTAPEDGNRWGIGFDAGYDSGYKRGFAAADVQYDAAYEHGYDDGYHDARVGRPGFIAGFLTALAMFGALFAMSCSAQTTPQPTVLKGSGPFNYGYVVDSARIELEQAWDSRNPYQVERGYCIEQGDVQVDTAQGVVLWRVHHVHTPDSVALATPYAVAFSCGPNAIAGLHIHTPTTCKRSPNDPLGVHPKDCVMGGEDSALCSVDETDRMSARSDAFTVVQCDRRAFVFYWAGRRG